MAEDEQTDLTTLTVDLLSAYFANNTIESAELAGLIKTTHDALKALNAPPAETAAAPEFPPAVTVRKSLASHEHILSLIDGKPYKVLKRHLHTHGLTPAEYRARYNLAKDYPMVAPAYSEHRRSVAKALGLGRKAAASQIVAAPPPEEATPPVIEPAAPPKAPKKPSTVAAAKKPRQARKIAPSPEIVADAPAEPVAKAARAPRKPKTAAPAKAADSVKPATRKAPRKRKAVLSDPES
jgi:predicted transcriptional regulator